jgi:hypothetical protein
MFICLLEALFVDRGIVCLLASAGGIMAEEGQAGRGGGQNSLAAIGA